MRGVDGQRAHATKRWTLGEKILGDYAWRRKKDMERMEGGIGERPGRTSWRRRNRSVIGNTEKNTQDPIEGAVRVLYWKAGKKHRDGFGKEA